MAGASSGTQPDHRPGSFDELDAMYGEVAEELRHQYALYYTPLDKGHDGRFRRVQVETVDRALKVTARVGYYAASGPR